MPLKRSREPSLDLAGQQPAAALFRRRLENAEDERMVATTIRSLLGIDVDPDRPAVTVRDVPADERKPLIDLLEEKVERLHPATRRAVRGDLAWVRAEHAAQLDNASPGRLASLAREVLLQIAAHVEDERDKLSLARSCKPVYYALERETLRGPQAEKAIRELARPGGGRGMMVGVRANDVRRVLTKVERTPRMQRSFYLDFLQRHVALAHHTVREAVQDDFDNTNSGLPAAQRLDLRAITGALTASDDAWLRHYRHNVQPQANSEFFSGILLKMARVLVIDRPHGIASLTELHEADAAHMQEAVEAFNAFAPNPLPHPNDLRQAIDAFRAMTAPPPPDA